MFGTPPKEGEPQYFLFKNDYHSGPFTKEKIREMVIKDIIKDSDLVCLENTEEWKRAEEIFAESTDGRQELELPPVIAPPVLHTSVETPNRISIIQCRACGGEMLKSKAGGRSIFGRGFSLVTKLIILTVGVAFMFIPIVGWLIGAILIIYALFSSTGARNRKVWKCLKCGTFFERA
jgi:hypothetical protein